MSGNAERLEALERELVEQQRVLSEVAARARYYKDALSEPVIVMRKRLGLTPEEASRQRHADLRSSRQAVQDRQGAELELARIRAEIKAEQRKWRAVNSAPKFQYETSEALGVAVVVLQRGREAITRLYDALEGVDMSPEQRLAFSAVLDFAVEAKNFVKRSRATGASPSSDQEGAS